MQVGLGLVPLCPKSSRCQVTSGHVARGRQWVSSLDWPSRLTLGAVRNEPTLAVQWRRVALQRRARSCARGRILRREWTVRMWFTPASCVGMPMPMPMPYGC